MLDIPRRSDLDLPFLRHRLRVSAAIMVYKTCRPKEYGIAVPAAAENDAEVPPVLCDAILFLERYIHLKTIEVRDGTATRYAVPRSDTGVFTVEVVALCAVNVERTVGEVHLQTTAKIIKSSFESLTQVRELDHPILMPTAAWELGFELVLFVKPQIRPSHRLAFKHFLDAPCPQPLL